MLFVHFHDLNLNIDWMTQEKPEIREMKAKAQTDAYKVSATFTLHNKPVNALWQWSQVPQVEVTAYAMLPSTSVIKFTLGMRRSLSFGISLRFLIRSRACVWAAPFA